MLALICAAIEDPDDREFMTQFYLEYERLMYATARKNLSDPESIKDIVQESVLKLIPNISFLRQQENCIKASYVVSTVRNTAINHLRKQGRVTGKCSNLEDEDVVMPGPPWTTIFCRLSVWNVWRRFGICFQRTISFFWKESTFWARRIPNWPICWAVKPAASA